MEKEEEKEKRKKCAEKENTNWGLYGCVDRLTTKPPAL